MTDEKNIRVFDFLEKKTVRKISGTKNEHGTLRITVDCEVDNLIRMALLITLHLKHQFDENERVRFYNTINLAKLKPQGRKFRNRSRKS